MNSLLILSAISLFANINGVSAQSNSSGDGDLSLTLEQIFIITLLVGVLIGFLLERIGIIKDRSLLYRMLILAMFILTMDYFVQKEIILA